MKRILCSDWLSEWAIWAYLGISQFVPAKLKFFVVIFWPYNKPFNNQACPVKMAGYWPCSFFAFLLTETKLKLKSSPCAYNRAL